MNINPKKWRQLFVSDVAPAVQAGWVMDIAKMTHHKDGSVSLRFSPSRARHVSTGMVTMTTGSNTGSPLWDITYSS